MLATESRYAEAAERDCPDLELLRDYQLDKALATLAVARGATTLAFEAQDMTVERHAELAALSRTAPRPGPASAGSSRNCGWSRTRTEIALLGRACEITGEAFAAVLGHIVPGRTEREFAVLLERAMIDLGAEGLAFDTIVASGPNGAIPHHSPGARAFAQGDLITIDCGARFGGYHADMTRTVALGRAVAPGSARSTSWSRRLSGLAWPPPSQAPTSPTSTPPPVT